MKYNYKHGGKRNHPAEYNTWRGIKQRCYNPKASGYERYGAIGIRICDEWISDFARFLLDMGQKPDKTFSIERKNNSGPYSPDNCVWASVMDQARNRKSNIWLIYDGARRTLAEWSRELCVPHGTLRHRIKMEWSTEEVLFGRGVNNGR